MTEKLEIKYIDRASGMVKIEKPPAESFLKFLYHHPFGKMTLLPLVKRKFISTIYGKRMDKSSSKNKIKPFVLQHQIDMSIAKKSMDEFTSFNDFFYRKLKPESRPIGNGFTSPGDGKLLAFENIEDVQHFFVKGNLFTLPTFLEDDELAKKYKNASLLILRLAPDDYHRFHFPWDGIPSESKQIKGRYYSVSPHSVTENFARVFCKNKREYCILDTQEKGKIIIAPVGATMVGSIFHSYTPNNKVKKGDEMGYFAFGGSSIVILIDKEKIKIDADILQNTQQKLETYVKMGETIGQ